ncbi:helix-turn-helix domain-containing protein [Atopobacter phocae]|uniref:helix-turn-helix domain-containing protein n=1 Tax=Atopobacter phocae TaxID=136492 RepID=UPI00046F79BC|nr:RodZ domain-containing protein [Atopobacter phocae]
MKQIGDVLKAARLEKGFSYQDLEQLTKIQQRYLEAIDENNFDELPSQFYTRAFVKQYAEAVNIDGDWLLNTFDFSTSDLKAAEQSNEPLNVPSRRASRAGFSTWQVVTDTVRSFLPLFVLLGFVVMLIILLVTAFNRTENSHGTFNRPTITQQTQTEVNKEKKEPETKIKEKGISVDYSIISNDNRFSYLETDDVDLPAPIKISSSEDGQTWISVQADDVVLYEGLLSYGNSETLEIPKNTKKIAINAGYAPATFIEIEGRKMEFPQDPKQYQTQYYELTFKASDRDE